MDPSIAQIDCSGEDMISLNVGGRVFLTTESTLRKCGPDSFFSRLLENRKSGRITTTTDNNGAIFIDRDPAPFERILSFLRSSIVNLDCDINADILLKEAEFYGIESLLHILRPSPPETCKVSPELENCSPDNTGRSSPRETNTGGSLQQREPFHNNIKICKFYALLDPSKYECSLSTIIERCFTFYTSRIAVITRQIEEHEWFVTVLMQDCILDKRGLQKLISICLACGITNFTFYDGVELTENNPHPPIIGQSAVLQGLGAGGGGSIN